MFALIRKLDQDINVHDEHELRILANVSKVVTILFRAFAVCYAFAWIVLAIQEVFGNSVNVFWTSTALYPGTIGQNRPLYWIVFVFQAFANAVLVFLTFICDTYGFIVTMILSGFIDVLSTRLNNLGQVHAKIDNKNVADATNERIDASQKLIGCVKTFYISLE